MEKKTYVKPETKKHESSNIVQGSFGKLYYTYTSLYKLYYYH